MIQLAGRLFAILLCCALGSAHAADKPGNGTKRVALVIGNGNYQGSLPKLGNPAHDAEDIAKALRGFGFEVIERTNQGLEGMNNAIAEFSRKAGNSEAALFYFAGHGLQVKGQNYLIPVDANIETEARVQYVSVNVNQVLDEMDNAKSRVNIVMLDACRNNPISGKFRSGATRGLAPVTSQPKGTVIVYATDPGNVASDGEGRNGLFTAGVLTAFKGGDLSLHGVLLRASAEVERGSGQTQTPYINGPATLQQSFRFAAGTQVAQLGGGIGGLASSRTPQQIEDELWDTIKDNDRPSVFEEYIKGYPKGRYVTQAKVKIVALKETVKPVAPPAPASVQTVYASDPETALWNEVQKGNAADDYDVYMKQYPKGKFVALAKQRLQKLKDEARQQAEAAEQSAWQAAEGAQTPEGYAAYLASHPNGRYAALAQMRANKLKADAAAQEERRLWQVAEKGGKAEVDTYLGRYPSGRYASAAQMKLVQITARVAEEQRKAREDFSRGSQWAESDNGEYIDWFAAGRYCTSKGSGWRLPTIAELQSNYRSGISTACGEYMCKVASKSRLTGTFFWTKEPNGFSEAWGVFLLTGLPDSSPVRLRFSSHRALCVRQI